MLEELRAGTILENMRHGRVMFFAAERSPSIGLSSSVTYEDYLPNPTGCHSR